MTYIFLGFFLGAAISYVLTRYYYEKVIDEWRLLYHNCRCEMDRLYKKKDELYEKFKEADKVIAELKSQKAQAEDEVAFWKCKAEKLKADYSAEVEEVCVEKTNVDTLEQVLKENDKEIQRLENLCESYRIDCDNLAIREANAYKEIGRDNKRIRHQKYKRCLDKAELCHWKMVVFVYHKKKNDFYYRWHKRWLELAEKFKEVK